MVTFEPRFCRTAEDFENAARDWMLSWGFSDAFTTSKGADGGVDVESDRAIAQVKATTKQTGRPHVQRLRGAAFDGRQAFFFSLGGYTNEARMYADASEVKLFRFSAYDGSVEAINKAANSFLRSIEDPEVCGREESWADAVNRIGGLSRAGVNTESVKEIADIVMSSLESMEARRGFSIFVVIGLENRFVQFASENLLIESVGVALADPPLTVGQVDTLRELRFEKGQKKKDNFQRYFEADSRLREIAECILVALLDIHGLADAKNLSVELGSFD